MIADVVGYSRLMERDEAGTHMRLREIREQVVDRRIVDNGGRIIRTSGDGMLVEFTSATAAMRCAVQVQREMGARNLYLAPDQRIDFRIGINLGDIIVNGTDIEGDGVNVAARLETLAEPGGICISASVREQARDDLGVGFADIGEQQVKNIARPIRVYRVTLRADTTRTNGRALSPSPKRGISRWWLPAVAVAVVIGLGAWLLPRFWKNAATTGPPALSVAILPFAAVTGSPTDERFADEFTRDLTMALGRNMPDAPVASHDLADSYKGKAVDARAVGRELNVRFLVEGELRRAGDQVAVNVQLIDTGNATQVWSDRLALDASPALQQQGDLVERLTYRLRDAVTAVELRRVGTQPAPGADARELQLRGINVFFTATDKLKGALEARKLYEDALRLDPNLVGALIGRAYTLQTQLEWDPRADHDRLVQEIDELSRRAVAINDKYPTAWFLRTQALAWQWRWDAAFEANAQNLKLDPVRSAALSQRAQLMIFTGHPAEALDLVDKAFARDPQIPREIAGALFTRCNAALFLGHYDDAIAACEQSAAEDDNWYVHAFLVAAYAQKGDTAKAAAEKSTLLKMRPWFSIADFEALRFSNDPVFLRLTETQFLSGLRKAGISEK